MKRIRLFILIFILVLVAAAAYYLHRQNSRFIFLLNQDGPTGPVFKVTPAGKDGVTRIVKVEPD